MSEIEKEGRRGRRRRAAVEEVEEVVESVEEDDTASRGITAKKGYATAGRRTTGQDEPERRGLIARIQDYYVGVRSELDKVSWPTQADVVRLMRLVVIVTLLAAILLGLLSLGFAQLFISGLDNPLVFLIFGVIIAALSFFIWRANRNSSDPSETFNTRL